MLLELPDDAPFLQLVDLDHGAQELEVVPGVRRELLQRDSVLGEAAAAPADPGTQEVRAEPVVEANPLRNLLDVGAGGLADVRDLVDEADACHQEGVGGELDHLRGSDVRAHDRRVDRLVERCDDARVHLRERADDDAVRVHEVLDRAALGEELGIGDVAHVREPARVESRPNLLAGPDRHRALHHEDRPLLERRERVDHAPDGGQVGVARVGRRCADADEHDGRRDDLLELGAERQPLAVALEQLVETGLVQRQAPGLQGLDPLGHDVADDHLVPELGQARPRDEADPAGPKDPNCGLFPALHAHEPTGPSGAGRARWQASSRSRAS